jgi:hypothetical protein
MASMTVTGRSPSGRRTAAPGSILPAPASRVPLRGSAPAEPRLPARAGRARAQPGLLYHAGDGAFPPRLQRRAPLRRVCWGSLP